MSANVMLARSARRVNAGMAFRTIITHRPLRRQMLSARRVPPSPLGATSGATSLLTLESAAAGAPVTSFDGTGADNEAPVLTCAVAGNPLEKPIGDDHTEWSPRISLYGWWSELVGTSRVVYAW